MAAGDFTPSALPKLLLALDDTMNDSRVQQRQTLMPPTDIIEQVKNIETANWNSVRPNDQNCMDFDVAWLEESDTEATSLTGQSMIHRPVCTFEGEELQSNKKTYRLDNVISIPVRIKDEDCGNMFDTGSKVSLALLQAQKKILERWGKALPPLIDAEAGANLLNGVSFTGQDWNIGETNGTGTEIDPADLTLEKAVYYLQMAFQINKMQNPYIIDGGMFSFSAWLAGIQNGTGNADTGQWNAWKYIADRYRMDIVNMFAAGYMNKAFVIDQGQLAMPTVSFFPRLGSGENEVVANKYIYSIPMTGFQLNGQPIYLDVTYLKKEEAIPGGSGRCLVVHDFLLELKWDLWKAPKYTSDTVTGIITLNKGAAA